MRSYLHYSPEELAKDDFFIQWVTTPNSSSENFWQNWLSTNPSKREDLEVAIQLVMLANQVVETDVSNTEIKALKESIFERIEQIEQTITVKSYKIWYWASAAAVAGLAFFLSSYFLQNSSKSINSYENQIVSASKQYELVEVENISTSLKLVNLPDGSSILLKEGTKLSYPSNFSEKKREVYLTGEAFFEIAKDANKPFYVHANQITTKVLGTSFNISAYPTQKIVVSVKTGKVAIFKTGTEEATEQEQHKELTGIVLEKGEKAVFEKNQITQVNPTEAFVKTQIEAPIEQMSFEFEETNVRDIFKRIEKAYQIDIIYDDAVLGSCPITASLTDEPLTEKLKLICKAVHADYRKTSDDKILVTGTGCR